jgi:2-polyprenyl-3-methyl-5-hydroxy-6-metoxy-1,4-benzoquinol methylase
MNQKEVRRYLNVIKRAVAYIEAMLDNNDDGLLEVLASSQGSQSQPIHPVQPLQQIQPVVPSVVQRPVVQQVVQSVVQQPVVQQPVVIQPEPPQFQQSKGPSEEELKAFEAARKKHISDLMAIDCWPEAVPPFLMAKDASPQDQVNRANAVLDMMLDRNVEYMKFLDFGCGEGWIAQEIVKRGVGESVGFDIKHHKTWDTIKTCEFTTKFEDLKPSHFDIVMVYDVLDHTHNPLALMAQIKHVLKPNGVVYVRCHPWTAKHATHLYKQGINRAYFHMFLKYHEIKEIIGQEPMFTREEKNCLEAYRWWFNEFDIKKERMVKEPVSEFFYVPAFKELLANEQQIPMGHIDGFLKLMEIQFVDYVLVPKK